MVTARPPRPITARPGLAALSLAALSLAALMLAGPAWAAEPPPAESTPEADPGAAPAAPLPLDPAAAKALEHLAAGRFARASTAFEQLASSDDATTRAWAAHLAGLSQRWVREGKLLTGGAPDAAEQLDARAQRRRTTGEMALLYIDGVLYGLGTGGYVAVLAEPDSLTGVILPCLGLAGAAAGGLYLLDRADQLSYGVPRSVSTGLRLGLLDGALWTLWNAETGGDWGAKASVGVIWAATTVGAVAGGLIGEYVGATPGAASMVESAGLWGAALGGLWGYGVAELLDVSDSDELLLLSAAISVNLAAAAGALLAAEVEPSTSRVRYLDLGGLSGGVLLGGLYLAFADDGVEGSALAVTTGLGIAGGLATAWWLTGDMAQETFLDDSAVSANLMVVPTADGAAIGLGGTF